jgi:predicted  nucleic acid-binding Zn-ribbon protein
MPEDVEDLSQQIRDLTKAIHDLDNTIVRFHPIIEQHEKDIDALKIDLRDMRDDINGVGKKVEKYGTYGSVALFVIVLFGPSINTWATGG